MYQHSTPIILSKCNAIAFVKRARINVVNSIINRFPPYNDGIRKNSIAFNCAVTDSPCVLMYKMLFML